jgi:hypothetical protein
MNPSDTMTDREGFSKPVPTKLRPSERETLRAAKKATGFSNSELIRRAVRLLERHRAAAKGYGFLLELTPA